MIGYPKPLPDPKAAQKPIQRSRIKPKKRSAKEYARVYGSEERVQWMKRQPCLIAGQHSCFGEVQGHHIVNGGMSRKADHTLIVPLCVGAHQLLHTIGVASFCLVWSVNLVTEAARIAAKWVDEK